VTEREDRRLLREAIELSRNAPPSQASFSVGSVVARDGKVLATGYSRERGPQSHAEQVALEKAEERRLNLHGATLYTSLEPCSARRSDAYACAARILDAGIARVVFAMREPPVFVEGEGAEKLADGGVEVLELGEEAPLVAQINAHLLKG
jgi:pyrimidine deaminase RibD-like protein